MRRPPTPATRSSPLPGHRLAERVTGSSETRLPPAEVGEEARTVPPAPSPWAQIDNTNNAIVARTLSMARSMESARSSRIDRPPSGLRHSMADSSFGNRKLHHSALTVTSRSALRRSAIGRLARRPCRLPAGSHEVRQIACRRGPCRGDDISRKYRDGGNIPARSSSRPTRLRISSVQNDHEVSLKPSKCRAA